MAARLSDIASLLDIYDRVVADAGSHLAEEAIAPVAAIGHQVRKRRTLTERVFLVGLLGGTGSGKSSLLNALAGIDISPAGAMRPTTARPRAWVPRGRRAEVDAALAFLGLEEVVEHDLDEGLAVLDLPDIDSFKPDNRLEVDAILPYLDMAIWVTDPEKYRDRVLHHEFLRPLAAHQAMFRFVLNQIDRVEGADLHSLVPDLEDALRADGINHPVVWATAADPPSGPPVGIEPIWEGIRAARGTGHQRDEELIEDLRRGSELLATHLETVDFSPRWEAVRRNVAGHILAGKLRLAREQLVVFVESVGPQTPIDFEAVLTIASQSDDPARSLDLGMGRQLRDQLRPRARTRALLVELQLALATAADPV